MFRRRVRKKSWKIWKIWNWPIFKKTLFARARAGQNEIGSLSTNRSKPCAPKFKQWNESQYSQNTEHIVHLTNMDHQTMDPHPLRPPLHGVAWGLRRSLPPHRHIFTFLSASEHVWTFALYDVIDDVCWQIKSERERIFFKIHIFFAVPVFGELAVTAELCRHEMLPIDVFSDSALVVTSSDSV